MMGKKILGIFCGMIASFVCASAMMAGTTQLVITNDDVPNAANSLTVYKLDSTTGTLTPFKVVETNGMGIGGGFFSTRLLALNSSCVFASNSGSTIGSVQSGDIAAFTANNLTLVGNYSDPNLIGVENGIGLALNPNGQYLYAAYTTARKLAVWKVHPDCSLTLASHIGAGGQVAGMAVAQQSNGSQYLVASYPYYPFTDYVNMFQITNGGATLVEQPEGRQVASGAVGGVEVTADGNVAVFGDTNDFAQLESWWISNTPGSCNPSTAAPPCLIAHQNFNKVARGNNSNNIRLSPAAATDPVNGGCMYITNNGDYRITTAKFIEGTTPGAVSITATLGSPFTVTLGDGVVYLADIHIADSSPTGGMLLAAEYTNFVLTIPINSDCTLGPGQAFADNSFGASVLQLAVTAPGN